MVVCRLITVGSTHVYEEPPASGPASFSSYLGGFIVSNPRRLSLYWVLGTVVGYLATALYYRWRDRRSGVVSSVRPFLVTGVALFVLLLLVSPAGLALVGLPSTW